MDWGKAKSILIIVFIALNIFLMGNISLDKLSKGSQRDAIQSTQTILGNNGIRLTCKIPDFDGTMGRIEIYDEPYFNIKRAAVKLMGSKTEIPDKIEPKWRLSDGKKEFVLEDAYTFKYTDNSPEQKWDVSRSKTVEKRVRKFLEDNEINASGFIVDEYEEMAGGHKRIAFRQKYEGLNIFSNTITVVVSDKGVSELECSARKPGKLEKNSAKVIPAYKILLTYFSDLSGTVITGIDIGYNMNREGIGEEEESNPKPVWRIRMEGAEAKLFDANTGMEK